MLVYTDRGETNYIFGLDENVHIPTIHTSNRLFFSDFMITKKKNVVVVFGVCLHCKRPVIDNR